MPLKSAVWFPAVLAASLLAGQTGCSGDIHQKLRYASAEDLIRRMFESADADERRAAIDILSERGYGRRDPYLKGYRELAGDAAPTVRSAAIRALGRAGDARYVAPVLEGLKDKETGVRWDSAVALDSIVANEAVEPLGFAATHDASVDVRLACARALRHYRRQNAVDALLRCLDDPEFSVQYQANESLKELTGESLRPDPEAWRRVLAGKKDIFAPTTRPTRPWWDWMGVTGK